MAWLFQTDAQLDSSGRLDIYFQILNAIKEKPFLGYGLYGDRTVLGWTYTHNFFLEIIVDFGIPVGLTLVLTYSIRLIRGLKTEYAQRFISIVGIYVTGMLLTSSSYLQCGAFGVALGVILSMTGKYRFVLGHKR